MTNEIIDQIILKNETIRDMFLKISSISSAFTLSKVILDQQLAREILGATTDSLIQLLNECTFETKGTQIIDQIEWPKDLVIGTFRSKTCLLYVEDVQREILALSNDHESASKKDINVRVFDISWLCKESKTFADFVAILTECKRNSIFESKLVSFLLDEFWKEDQERIIMKLMIPYFVYMIIAQWFIIFISA